MKWSASPLSVGSTPLWSLRRRKLFVPLPRYMASEPPERRRSAPPYFPTIRRIRDNACRLLAQLSSLFFDVPSSSNAKDKTSLAAMGDDASEAPILPERLRKRLNEPAAAISHSDLEQSVSHPFPLLVIGDAVVGKLPPVAKPPRGPFVGLDHPGTQEPRYASMLPYVCRKLVANYTPELLGAEDRGVAKARPSRRANRPGGRRQSLDNAPSSHPPNRKKNRRAPPPHRRSRCKMPLRLRFLVPSNGTRYWRDAVRQNGRPVIR